MKTCSTEFLTSCNPEGSASLQVLQVCKSLLGTWLVTWCYGTEKIVHTVENQSGGLGDLSIATSCNYQILCEIFTHLPSVDSHRMAILLEAVGSHCLLRP